MMRHLWYDEREKKSLASSSENVAPSLSFKDYTKIRTKIEASGINFTESSTFEYTMLWTYISKFPILEIDQNKDEDEATTINFSWSSNLTDVCHQYRQLLDFKNRSIQWRVQEEEEEEEEEEEKASKAVKMLQYINFHRITYHHSLLKSHQVIAALSHSLFLSLKKSSMMVIKCSFFFSKISSRHCWVIIEFRF